MRTFVVLSLQNLARCLMLKLVVFAQVVLAERALKDAAAVVPDVALALAAHGVRQGASARVGLEALAPVAHPSFAKVADRTLINQACYGNFLLLVSVTYHHSQSRGEHPGMPNDTVSGLGHALRLAAVRTHRKPLHALAKVAECPVPLFPTSNGLQMCFYF